MVLLVSAAVGGLFLILNYTRLGIRIRAGTLDLETVSVLGVNVRVLRNLNFGLGIYLAGLAGVLAVGMLGLQPTVGDNLIMPSFIAIIVGGLGSLPGTLAGGISDRRRLRRHHRVPARGERSGDVCDDGGGTDRSAARASWVRRAASDAAIRQTRGRYSGLGRTAQRAVLAAADRQLYRARQPRRDLCARRHGAQFPARLYRRAVVRPRRLFRARRLRHGADHQIYLPQHAGRHAGRDRARHGRRAC